MHEGVVLAAVVSFGLFKQPAQTGLFWFAKSFRVTFFKDGRGAIFESFVKPRLVCPADAF
jgi:hypothetical protein